MSADTTAASDDTRASIVEYIRGEAAKLEALAVKFFDQAADAKYGGSTAEYNKSQGRAYRLQGQFLDVMAKKIENKVDQLKVCAPLENT